MKRCVPGTSSARSRSNSRFSQFSEFIFVETNNSRTDCLLFIFFENTRTKPSVSAMNYRLKIWSWNVNSIWGDSFSFLLSCCFFRSSGTIIQSTLFLSISFNAPTWKIPQDFRFLMTEEYDYFVSFPFTWGRKSSLFLILNNSAILTPRITERSASTIFQNIRTTNSKVKVLEI